MDGGPWYNSGYTQAGLTSGWHTVEFTDIPLWNKPDDIDVYVNCGQATSITGNYVLKRGSLTVTIYPLEVTGPAQWHLTTWKGMWPSGYTQTGIPIGDYTLGFEEVSCWLKPVDQSVTINEGSNSASGTYYYDGCFADAALQSAVEAELGISYPTLEDMPSLTQLCVSPYVCGQGPACDLTGLEYASNLQYLDLYWSQCVGDISPLAGLASLTELDLGGNVISDITPLAGLTNLDTLRLASNDISDISTLANLTQLSWLDLSENPLNMAAYCTYIPIIRSNNPGIAISYDPNPHFIRDCALLAAVEGALGISSPTPADMPSLTGLNAVAKGIVDLTGLEYATNLTSLDLGVNSISDISALSGLTNTNCH